MEDFTCALAKEIGGRGITVDTIAPGPLNTSFFYPAETRESTAFFRSRSINGKLGEVKNIVPLVKFLVSAEANWVTAQTIFINGGHFKARTGLFWRRLLEANAHPNVHCMIKRDHPLPRRRARAVSSFIIWLIHAVTLSAGCSARFHRAQSADLLHHPSPPHSTRPMNGLQQKRNPHEPHC